ncbi:MAG: corrinoid protein [Dehalococcoidia bacterium]|nr:corrinoid protein [Dehalococcoidia bacterium]
MALYEDLKVAVIDMEVERAVELTKKALGEGRKAEDIMNGSLVPAMDIVGEQYDKGEKYVPEMLLSAKAMKTAMEVLHPLLVESGVEMKGKLIIGTVEGDLHDIGKDLVAMMVEGAGFEVINLGAEITAEQFLNAVREHKPNIIGMSALLTTTMLHMPEVIDALKQASLRDQVKVMIGGAPVTQEYADEIGADGYAPDAASAVKLANKLLQ